MIATNVIIPFDGNHAEIPSGFTRATTLDGLYPKATAVSTNPNTTGGTSTHTHTSAAHSHTLASHTHAYSLSAITAIPNKDHGSTGLYAHSHSGTTGGSSGGTTDTTAATYGAFSNDPSYYTVIFIKATGSRNIPNNAMVLKEGTTRTNLTFHTDSANKFLKGAATSANSGGTGGSTTNIHSLSHTHGVNTHTQANSTCGGATNQIRNAPNGNAGGRIIRSHTHTVSVQAGSQAINTYSSSLTTVETVEPAYRKINAFKNDSGGNVSPMIGDIGLWLGTLSNIPSGWVLCDGTHSTPDMRSKFLKINSSATTTSTGGSNTHTHTSQSHNHTSSGTHTHTGNNTGNHTAVSNDTDNTGGSQTYDKTVLKPILLQLLQKQGHIIRPIQQLLRLVMSQRIER